MAFFTAFCLSCGAWETRAAVRLSALSASLEEKDKELAKRDKEIMEKEGQITDLRLGSLFHTWPWLRSLSLFFFFLHFFVWGGEAHFKVGFNGKPEGRQPFIGVPNFEKGECLSIASLAE